MIPLKTVINQKVKVFDCPMLPLSETMLILCKVPMRRSFVEFYGKINVYGWTWSIGGMTIARGKPSY